MNVNGNNVFFRRILLRILLLSGLFLYILVTPVQSAQKYVIDPSRSTLVCSVNYVVVGKYVFQFKDFNGAIFLDDTVRTAGSMSLTIETQSLISNHPYLDQIARSSRLLDTEKYPTSHIEGSFWQVGPGHFMTQETIQICGHTQTQTFPFNFLEKNKSGEGVSFVRGKGSWVLPRKDFGLTWHQIWDKGGLIVGNHVTIDWDIVAIKQTNDQRP